MANGNRNRPTGGTIGLMAAVRWLGAVAWAGSWYLMYLEITRWHHVRPDLTFNKCQRPVRGPRWWPGESPRSGVVQLVLMGAPFAVLASRMR
jgi:hypothetical protein